MLQLIAITAGAAIAGVLGLAARRPDTFRVQRTATIGAPPEAIHPLIEDFHRWTEWSPWEALDPAMRRTYGGAPRGPGATYAWEGKKAGSGQMEILESSPARTRIRLDFIKPFQAHNMATFTLEPRGADTQVTWTMDGPSPFVSKVMGVFVNMENLVGKDFEAGLAKLKAAAEG